MMSVHRISPINDGESGETEHDANSALTELDRGLRSGEVGEQCEAIVRFPKLFEKYPFPILINSSFLKLADVFRTGSNLSKLWVLRVCQQSEKHLDKILNIDEFVHRVYGVIHSNDPVARSFTLRTLGSVAGIIPEQQQVHHSIRCSLDSHDMVEVEAAIYAAMQFAAQSKTFAVTMCNKISHMIKGLATPTHMKLQLIPILQHMHHDTSTAAMVTKLCTDLLPEYPAQDFVVATLKTLTHLAKSTLVEIPNQVELLLDYLVKDPRREVHYCVLQCLYLLAKDSAYLWPDTSIATLVNIAQGRHPSLVICALDVLIALTRSAAVCNGHAHTDSELMSLCHELNYSLNAVVATKSIQIMTHILIFSFKEQLVIRDCENGLNALESLFLLLTATCTEKSCGTLRTVLHCIISLCKVQFKLCPRFVQLISTSLMETAEDWSASLLGEALCAIGGMQRHSTLAFLPHFLKKLGLMGKKNVHTKVILCTLVFQCATASQLASTPVETALTETVNSINFWASYKIARAAARYGHMNICARIISQLKEHVSSEHLHFWLVTLEEMSLGETCLRTGEDYIDRLGLAISHYCKALVAIKAASTQSQSFTFQAEYMRLRYEMLQCFSHLIATCKTFSSCPANAIAKVSNDVILRFGAITTRLKKCAGEFKACGEQYWRLYQLAFDADPISLNNIQILQHMCSLIAYNIQSVLVIKPEGHEPTLDPSIEYCLETQMMIQSCEGVTALSNSIDTKPITHLHIEGLIKQVEMILNDQFCIPRYFFQVLQSTTVKLAITPQPRNNDVLTIQAGSHLAVKVEGVIQHGLKPGHFRTVSGIVLNLSSQLMSRTGDKSSGYGFSKPVDGHVSLCQKVTPHRDFFTAQFLLPLAGSGQHHVTIVAAVQDDSGNIWNTGTPYLLVIKTLDESGPGRARTSY